jgi:hypothetical protein
VDAQNLTSNGALAAGRVEDVFMAEWSEILMSVGGKWNAGDSSGEGLSQFCSILRFQTGHYNYYGSFVDNWLNGTGTTNQGRQRRTPPDRIGSTRHSPVRPSAAFSYMATAIRSAFGCALAFLFYLNTQLSFSINQIIAAGSPTYGLSVSLNVGGTQVSGSQASTEFELLAGADPLDQWGAGTDLSERHSSLSGCTDRFRRCADSPGSVAAILSTVRAGQEFNIVVRRISTCEPARGSDSDSDGAIHP